MREHHEAPRVVTVLLLSALVALLFYPLHRPYIYPDQDLPATLPLFHMARASWRPRIINPYGSALPNLLHLFDAVAVRIGRVAGWWTEPADLLVAWCEAPWLFRLAPRAVAMAAGVASLLAARRITGCIADGWSALAAPAILGTWLIFVREHHHGLYDAPAAGCAMLALWAATAYAQAPRLDRMVAAGALAGLATSFKYNLAPAVPAVLAATLVVERGLRIRAAVAASAAAIAAFVLMTPEVLFDTARLRAYLAVFIPLQRNVLVGAAGLQGNQLVESLSRGIGWTGLALAGAGLALAAVRRDRALAPLLAFVAFYGAVLVGTPLVLARYALPIAGPLAVLAAYGLSGFPVLARGVVVVCLVGLGLPGCVEYVRLLAVEDTRTEAARLVEAEWARGGHVLIAANAVLASYVGPDLPQLPRYDPGLPLAVERVVAARAPRCVRPLETLFLPPATSRPEALRPYAGALVLTSDSPAPAFGRASTPAHVAAFLEREATLVADLQVERIPAPREYEVLDLNYIPFTGLASLARPGPRLRLWRLPE